MEIACGQIIVGVTANYVWIFATTDIKRVANDFLVLKKYVLPLKVSNKIHKLVCGQGKSI